MWLKSRRLVDVVVASAAVPLVAFVAAAVWITSRDPVFYRQQRIGFEGKPFTIYKFKTMRDDPSGKQITRAGRWLRRLGCDELPQFCNILRGDMSLIGPRPMPQAEVDVGRACAGTSQWDRRYTIKPGLVPPSLIEEKFKGQGYTDPEQRLKADLEYIERRKAGAGLTQDLHLLWRAACVVLMGRIDPQAKIPAPVVPAQLKPAPVRG